MDAATKRSRSLTRGVTSSRPSAGDGEHARTAFTAARAEVEQIVQHQRDNAPALCVLV